MTVSVSCHDEDDPGESEAERARERAGGSRAGRLERASQVATGGRLIYSTCSLEREENENVVERASAEGNGFRLRDCGAELEQLRTEGELTWAGLDSLTRSPYLRTLPGIHPCDGFFAAILERI